MGPLAPNGCQWDGVGCEEVSSADLAALGDFIVRAATTAILGPGFLPEEFESALGRIVSNMLGTLFSSTTPPDIFGSITLRDSGVWAASGTGSFGVTDNSYEVDLGAMLFENVVLDSNVLVTLSLFDEDVAFNDPVGPVYLDRDQLIRAWLTGGNAWVLVADSHSDPVLQVQLRVVPTP
jgi:hypothetical protein